MVSFIIPAHNEAAWIGPTLKAIRMAADSLGVPYEMIVVNPTPHERFEQFLHALRQETDRGASVG